MKVHCNFVIYLLIYILEGGRFVPLMETVNEGVTSLKMVTKIDVTSSNASAASKVQATSPPYNYIWDQEDVENDPCKKDKPEFLHLTTLFLQRRSTKRNF